MKIKENIKITDEVLNILINHFNYSIENIDNYDELTPEEKKVISKRTFNLITESSKIRNYEEIISQLDLHETKLIKVENEEKYDVLTITGKTSSSIFYTFYDYMGNIQDIIEEFVNSDFGLSYNDIWLISWNTDLNGNWTLKIGVNK